MSLMNTFTLDMDLKSNSYISEPTITSNDTVRFVVNVSDDGLPFDLTNSTVLTLSSVRPDGIVVLKSGSKTGINQITFDLGTTEIAVAGRVEAKIQMYDTAGRVSTLRFSYTVDKDPSIDYIPSTNDKTLIQEVLGDGPAILAAAEEATENANTTASNVQAAEALRVTAESARVTAETTRKNAETARVTAEAARVTAETTRASNETARVTAEAARVTAETTRASNETARVTAEASRVTAETTRASNETARTTAETSRATAETTRKNAETARVTAETTRASNETARVTAETTRVNAESARVTAEAARVTAETTRASNETARVTAEAARVTAETTRASNETARGTAETARATAETSRVTAETTRVNAESARVTAEAARVTAETTRASNETARVTAETTRANAEAARVTAETTRASNETARGTAEAGRVTAESARVTAETTRASNETARVTAETTRAANETTRQTNETTRQTNETARQTAINAIVHKGAYAAGTAYVKNNSVSYNGSTYRCILNSTGNLPTNTTYWALEASKGADGVGQIISVSSTSTDLTIAGTSTDPTFTVNVTTPGGTEASKIAKTNASGRVGDAEKLGGQAPSYYATKTSVDDLVSDVDASPSATAVNLDNGLQVVTATKSAPVNRLNIKGRTLVNLLGRTGGFELNTTALQSAWAQYQGTAVFTQGNSATQTGIGRLDLTINSGFTIAAVYQPFTFLAGKTYLVAASIRCNTGTKSFVLANGVGAGNDIVQPDDGVFRTSYMTYTASTDKVSTIEVQVYGTAGQKTIADSVRVYEITAATKTLIDGMTVANAQVYIDKYYPYVDDVKHITAPYALKYGENLLSPLNEWTIDATTTITNPYSIAASPTGSGAPNKTSISVIAGQSYTFNVGSVTGTPNIYIENLDSNGNLISAPNLGTSFPITIIPPALTVKMNVVIAANAAGTYTVSNPMLNLGSTAKPFKPRNDELLAFPNVTLASNIDGLVYDTLFDRDGKFFVEKRLKDMTIDGGLTWDMFTDQTGFKRVRTILNASVTGYSNLTKFGGKNIIGNGGGTIADSYSLFPYTDATYANHLMITISDSDSGWGESYSPTPDEIKAYFNGWVMYDWSSSNVATKYNGTGAKGWAYRLAHYAGSPTAANMTGGVNVLPTTPAPYTGAFMPYKLTYQLATPTFEEIQVEGSLALHEGSNQIEVGQGIVIREKAYPVDNSLGSYTINNWSPTAATKRRVAKFLNVYKNGVIDSKWFYNSFGSTPNATYGAFLAYEKYENYDQNATYEVSYLALDQYLLSAPVQAITGEYSSNLKTVVDSLVADQADNEARISAAEQLARQIYNVPKQTTANMNLYVDGTNGSDSNDGSSARPFKTITRAMNNIPQVVNHTVNVYVAFGTYNETVNIWGINGSGVINVNGDVVGISTNVNVNNVLVTRCTIPINIVGFCATYPAAHSFSSIYCSGVAYTYCNTVVNSQSIWGFHCWGSKVIISSCQASNKYGVAVADTNSRISVSGVIGSGNTISFAVFNGGMIHKKGTNSVTSTNGDSWNEGGMIIPSTGVLNPWGDNTRSNRSSASVYNTASLTVTNGSTWYKVPFNAKAWDFQTEYDTTNCRYVSTKTGLIDVKASVAFPSASAGSKFIIAVYKNGTMNKQMGETFNSNVADHTLVGSATVDVIPGDYLEIYVLCTSAGNSTFNTNATICYATYTQIA